MTKKLSILGTRGIPAQHGGFETFAEYLAQHLTKHAWKVTVYCQEEGSGEIYEDYWKEVRLVRIPINHTGALGTILFDWISTLHAAREKNLILTLGYNTAVFSIVYKMKGVKQLINMDGIEWKRAKWTRLERVWLYINERAACFFGDLLIADHPEIKRHLETRVSKNKIAMIPYGANVIEEADQSIIEEYGLEPNKYAVVIARPEPENSILEIVTAFSKKRRNRMLVVLGNFSKANPDYRKRVFEAASKEVVFPGAIYDSRTVSSLRFYAALYIHGHQVGGTNPSLVEALSAGNAVLSYDSVFNRWVAGVENSYFTDTDSCNQKLDHLLYQADTLAFMGKLSREQHKKYFTWKKVLESYEQLLEKYV